ncbi:hypothetical protein PENSPDRAFT_479169 [Peniophora sp. CONT]|nr:hypothetical protein PENSPDRAFT_479169 [Peniophora sp. CONT]
MIYMRFMHFLDTIRSMNLISVPNLRLALHIARPYARGYRTLTLKIRDLIAYFESQRDVRLLAYTFSPTSSRRHSNERDVNIHAFVIPENDASQGDICVTLKGYPRDDLLAEVMEGLPPGWEKRLSPSGQPYFVNHTTRTTTHVDPRTSPPHHCPFSGIQSLVFQVPPLVRLQVDTAWWFKNFGAARRVREVRVKEGFDSAFALVRALATAHSKGQVLFPNLLKLCIADGEPNLGAAQTIGWRRVRALQRCLARDKGLSGVTRIKTLSLPSRFETAKWVPHLRGTVERLQFE